MSFKIPRLDFRNGLIYLDEIQVYFPGLETLVCLLKGIQDKEQSKTIIKILRDSTKKDSSIIFKEVDSKYKFQLEKVNAYLNFINHLGMGELKFDYKKDNKKDNYIECCNELYIITNDYSVKLESEKNRNITGIIYYDTLRNSINVYKNDITNNNVKLNKDEVVKKIYNKYWNKIHKI